MRPRARSSSPASLRRRRRDRTCGAASSRLSSYLCVYKDRKIFKSLGGGEGGLLRVAESDDGTEDEGVETKNAVGRKRKKKGRENKVGEDVL